LAVFLLLLRLASPLYQEVLKEESNYFSLIGGPMVIKISAIFFFVAAALASIVLFPASVMGLHDERASSKKTSNLLNVYGH
jgi:hypothetical protein